MNIKITLLLTSSLLLFGCQSLQIDNDAPLIAKTVAIDFEFPADIKKPPKRIAGPEKAKVVEGDSINFKFDSGAGLVVIMGETSPFVNNEFVLKINQGRNNTFEIGKGKIGDYKYMVIDTSNPDGKRPPLDPYIVVGPKVQ